MFFFLLLQYVCAIINLLKRVCGVCYIYTQYVIQGGGIYIAARARHYFSISLIE